MASEENPANSGLSRSNPLYEAATGNEGTGYQSGDGKYVDDDSGGSDGNNEERASDSDSGSDDSDGGSSGGETNAQTRNRLIRQSGSSGGGSSPTTSKDQYGSLGDDRVQNTGPSGAASSGDSSSGGSSGGGSSPTTSKDQYGGLDDDRVQNTGPSGAASSGDSSGGSSGSAFDNSRMGSPGTPDVVQEAAEQVQNPNTVEGVRGRAVDQLNSEVSGDPFSADDVQVQTATRDGERVATPSLSPEGESTADAIQSQRRQRNRERLRQQLQDETDATLSDSGITIAEEDGQFVAELTDEGRRREAAAQSDRFGAADFRVEDDGSVTVTDQALREDVASSRDGVSVDDVTVSEQETESGEVAKQAQIERGSVSAIDQAVSRFESVTGVDVPGDGAVIPDIDVSEEAEATADGALDTLAANEYVSGAADVYAELDERNPAGGQDGFGTPEPTPERGEAPEGGVFDAASSAVDATQETVDATQEAAGSVADAVPSGGGQDGFGTPQPVPERSGVSEQGNNASNIADAGRAVGAAATVGLAASPLGQIVGNDRVRQTAGDTATPSQEQLGQAASAAGDATIPFTSTSFSEAPSLIPRAAEDVAQAGQVAGNGVEALRVSDNLGAQSDAEARAEAQRVRANPLSQFGQALETDLAQFTSSDPDAVVASRVEESRRQDSIEAARQGPSASPAPAIGRNPAGAIRGLSAGARAVQSGQAARTAGGVAAVIGGGLAVTELGVPDDLESSDRSELSIGGAGQDVTEIERAEIDDSELGVGQISQDINELDVSNGERDGAAVQLAGAQVGQTIQDDGPSITDDDIINTPTPSIPERDISDDRYAPEREFPTGGGAVVGNSNVSDPVEEARDQTRQSQQPTVGTGDGVGVGNTPSVRGIPGFDSGPFSSPGTNAATGAGLNTNIGVETGAAVGLTGGVQSLQTGPQDATANVNSELNAEEFPNEFRFQGSQTASRRRRLQIPGLDDDESESPSPQLFDVNSEAFDTGVSQSVDDAFSADDELYFG